MNEETPRMFDEKTLELLTQIPDCPKCYGAVAVGVVLGIGVMVVVTTLTEAATKQRWMSGHRIRNILIGVGLLVWIGLGAGLFYEYVILDKQRVSFQGMSLVIIRNRVTGGTWTCSALGCGQGLPKPDVSGSGIIFPPLDHLKNRQ